MARTPRSFLPTLAVAALAALASCSRAPDNATQDGSSLPDGQPSDAAPADATAPDASAPDASAPDASAPDAAASPPEVTTASGPVRGTRGTGYREFLGVPYAAPPVGPLRWRPPQPPAPWAAPRDATAAPARCPQYAPAGLNLPGSEDCLYLNVDTPDPAPQNAPVLVWIHGGSFVFGEGLQVDHGTRGDVLARERGVVVVTVNYRLGALGYLAHPALAAESGNGSGNYGLLDQQAALRWVRDNIAAFGGDPSRVTLFGESAGGMSVCYHLVAPSSAGLYQRALVESGPCGIALPARGDAEAQGQRFASLLGCDAAADVPACLRAATTDQVTATLPPADDFAPPDATHGNWLPIVDGTFLPQQPMAALRAGNFTKVPTAFGWNRDEGTLFVELANGWGIDEAQYESLAEQLAPGHGAEIVARYPTSQYPTTGDAFAAALGDFGIACPARRAWLAMAPSLPAAYQYYFTFPNPAFQLATQHPLGAFHSSEIQYVFGHPAQIGRMRFLGADLALHQAMAGYWTRFAASADPNGEGAVPWPAFDVAGDAHLVLDTSLAAGHAASADACAFWESLGVLGP